MRYEYVAWKDEGLWTVHAPAVPGVYGVGRTLPEARRDFGAALETLVGYLAERGEPRPRPTRIRTGAIEI